MDKAFYKYKKSNTRRMLINEKLWKKLERHGFPSLAKKMITRNRYGERIVNGDIITNGIITRMLEDSKPCMVARFGFTELKYLYAFLNHQNNMTAESQKELDAALENLCLLSGFFPNDQKMGERFAELYFESIPYMDLCGVWDLYMEDYFLDQYAPNCELAKLKYLEPWNTEGDKPWSAALKDKKVLVIHPFQKSIEAQYSKNKLIFSNKFEYEKILPDFQLLTIRAVQSLGGENDEYDNWFDALSGMISQIKELDFDVAIIGCGAYGLPLAAEIKKMGKKAIHLGGATQLMFGIWGNRWEQIPRIKQLYNDSWIRASADEKPRRADEVENGCYW